MANTKKGKLTCFLKEKGAFFVAEIGKNFIQTEKELSIDEYIANAKKLIKLAKESGADAVKFQIHEIEDEHANVNVSSPHFNAVDRYSWIKRNTNATPILFWKEIKSFCDEIGICFFVTPMSKLAAMKLKEIDVPFWKVGSGDLKDFLLLDYLVGTGKPIIISTGMASFAELDETVKFIRSRGGDLAILYCVSLYPCPVEEFNLSTIKFLQEKYPDLVIGFSDHSIGNDEIALASVKIGARIIEKHFSISRDLWGADHKASLMPIEFGNLVKKINSGLYNAINEKKFMGVKNKELHGASSIFRTYFEKTLVASKNIEIGEVITTSSLFAMRPHSVLGGFNSSELLSLLGRKAVKSFKKYEVIDKDGLSKKI